MSVEQGKPGGSSRPRTPCKPDYYITIFFFKIIYYILYDFPSTMSATLLVLDTASLAKGRASAISQHRRFTAVSEESLRHRILISIIQIYDKSIINTA